MNGEPTGRGNSQERFGLTDFNEGTEVATIEKPKSLEEAIKIIEEFEYRERVLKGILEHYKKEAMTNGLTGVFTRKYFESFLSKQSTLINETVEIERRGEKAKNTLSVIMLDIDHFKNVNDTYGHAAGDEVLKNAARVFTSQIREMDVLARYGGEEFIIGLPGANEKEALKFAERIRSEIEKINVNYEDKIIKVTISLGVAELNVDSNENSESLEKRADKALYKAKNSGRNQVIAASELK